MPLEGLLRERERKVESGISLKEQDILNKTAECPRNSQRDFFMVRNTFTLRDFFMAGNTLAYVTFMAGNTFKLKGTHFEKNGSFPQKHWTRVCPGIDLLAISGVKTFVPEHLALKLA